MFNVGAPVSPAAHSVIPGTVRASDDERQLGDLSASHGRDQLGSVLGDAAGLGIAAHHETGDVLDDQKHVIAEPILTSDSAVKVQSSI